MNTDSPLRYPGGKAAMAGMLGQIRRLNGLGDHIIAEPFAGGAGASLSLLFLEETREIHINDADPAIHDFWWAVLNRSDAFDELLAKTRVNITEWKRQRGVYRTTGRLSRLRRGFSAFYLNRCNRSGIVVNGGPIGGIHQRGPWKLDARYTKPELRRRCQRIAEYRERIHISCKDGVDFIEGADSPSTFFFVDPPYYVKGKTLYLNNLDEHYHSKLASLLNSKRDAAWVLTYDDCPAIRKLYRGWASIRPFSLRYVAAERRHGNELLITPKWMQLPKTQRSASIGW